MRWTCARRFGLSVLVAGGALPASAQTVAWYQFDPMVVPSTRTDPVLFEVSISGTPSRVALQLVSNDQLDLKDDGTSGDKQAGDGIFTVSIPMADITGVMAPDDVQRPFIGYLEVYSGTARVLQGNIFADVYTPDIGTPSITPVSSSVQWTQHLVNIVDPTYLTDGSVTAVANTFYQTFNDDVDFLNIVSAPTRFLNRDHVIVRNDVAGIGLVPNDGSGIYGSNGRLLGYSRFPIPTLYDAADTGYVHETGHQWINHLEFQPFASGVPHWPLSTMATGTMGFSVGGNGGEGGMFPCTFTVNKGIVNLSPTTAQPVFNDFDLYLMGLIGASDVHAQYVFTGLSSPPSCSGPYTGPTSAVDVNAIIAGAGARVPDVSGSPTHFRAATILVTRDALAAPETMWLYTWLTARAELQTSVPIHEGFVKSIGNPFFVATRGLATIDTTMTPPSPDFTLAAANPSVSVSRGATASFQISVLPRRGPFDQSVMFACGALPAPLTCTFSPSTVQPGETGTDVTLSVGTGTSSGSGVRSLAGVGSVWCVIVIVGARRRGTRVAAAAALLAVVTSCGGAASSGNTTPSTPPPNPSQTAAYVVLVTGTAGSLTHSVQLSLQVN